MSLSTASSDVACVWYPRLRAHLNHPIGCFDELGLRRLEVPNRQQVRRRLDPRARLPRNTASVMRRSEAL
jgi:hypothetical protein